MAKRILVVDDDDNLRGALRIHLEGAGYVVEEAADGEEAIEKYSGAESESPYDIILLDMIMEKVDGLRVLEFIRDCEEKLRSAIKDVKPIPIIMLTALPRGLVNTPYQEDDNYNSYISKPFEIDELLSKINKHLEKK